MKKSKMKLKLMLTIDEEEFIDLRINAQDSDVSTSKYVKTVLFSDIGNGYEIEGNKTPGVTVKNGKTIISDYSLFLRSLVISSINAKREKKKAKPKKTNKKGDKNVKDKKGK